MTKINKFKKAKSSPAMPTQRNSTFSVSKNTQRLSTREGERERERERERVREREREKRERARERERETEKRERE